MSRPQKCLLGALALLLAATPPPAHAQGIADRVARAPDGVVRMSFPARPGVCGYGSVILRTGPGGAETVHGGLRGGGVRDGKCHEGPVRVELNVEDGRVTSLDTFVGPADGAARTDLGTVPAPQAVDYLLGLSERAGGEVGEDALLPAVLAEGPPLHPRLLRLASRTDVPGGTREQAVFWSGQTGAPVPELARLYRDAESTQVREAVVFAYSQQDSPEARRELLRIARGDDASMREDAIFWLGQMAGEELAGQLEALVEDEGDLELREHAIFALSQRDPDEAVPALIRIARENPIPRLRERAVFWLAQTGDPRAVDFLEETVVR